MPCFVGAGPGPVPALDGENIVFGRVLEGLGAVAQVAAMPTFQPNERVQALNQVASLIGDDRAAKARILAASYALSPTADTPTYRWGCTAGLQLLHASAVQCVLWMPSVFS